MSEFCNFAYSRDEECVICGGHSLWFKSFFQCYLPRSSVHIGKRKKMVNGGCVAFDLLKIEGKDGPIYMIDEDSMKVVYGGF